MEHRNVSEPSSETRRHASFQEKQRGLEDDRAGLPRAGRGRGGEPHGVRDAAAGPGAPHPRPRPDDGPRGAAPRAELRGRAAVLEPLPAAPHAPGRGDRGGLLLRRCFAPTGGLPLAHAHAAAARVQPIVRLRQELSTVWRRQRQGSRLAAALCLHMAAGARAPLRRAEGGRGIAIQKHRGVLTCTREGPRHPDCRGACLVAAAAGYSGAAHYHRRWPSTSGGWLLQPDVRRHAVRGQTRAVLVRDRGALRRGFRPPVPTARRPGEVGDE
mmetsp:Transcript_33893/g.80371  ORF Transcript_33893/g.80371 Transcript_33893/m.80371 type:complete len:270 (-) Transcript_33893:35-844(-)